MTARSEAASSFAERLTHQVGRFDVTGKTLLIPNMAPVASRFLAASFRAFGVHAIVLPTYRDLSLGKQFTSGKECFPCQVTLGDILGFLRSEQARLGTAFDVRRYVYFMPEADGPCRFGMYNKMQRLVLDRFPDLREMPILYLSTADGYASTGLMPAAQAGRFRRLAYVSVLLADAIDRMTWRVRPYERCAGATDACMREAVAELSEAIETRGRALDFGGLFRRLEAIAGRAAVLIDPRHARKPRIGIVGEIYLRTHPDANQNLIRELERFGAEVVDASLAEWVNFISWQRTRKLRASCREAWRSRQPGALTAGLRQWACSRLEVAWQSWRQCQVYRRVTTHLDVQPDHHMDALETQLDQDRLFTFDIGTEAALSIGGALEYAQTHFNGVVNVFPFTCMPSTIASAILKPLLLKRNLPYLDASYDGAIQPNREVALRTFMYQASQHYDRTLPVSKKLG